MMKKLFKFNWMKALPIGIALLAGFQTSCKDSVDESNMYTFTGQTIYDYVSSDSNMTMFTKVLQKSKITKKSESTINTVLSARGNYTVFAPTDEAMKVFLDSIYGTTDYDIDTMSSEIADLITHNCIIDHGNLIALQTASFQEGAISQSALNDRHIMVSFDTLQGGKFVVKLNRDSHIIVPDVELTNGYVHVINKVINPSTAMLSALIAEAPNMRIFSHLLEITSWADTMYNYRDEVYENKTDAERQTNLKKWKYTVPKHRYYGYMAFPECDSIYMAEWGVPEPVVVDGTVRNWAEIMDVITKKCKEVYKDATSEDLTSQQNAVNQFVSYHIVNFKEPFYYLVRHQDEIGFNCALPNQLSVNINSFFHCIGKPNRLFKITHVAKTGEMRLNRHYYSNNAFDGDMKETSCDDEGLLISNNNGDYDINAVNGYYYPVNHIMVYTDYTRDVILNERIRYDMAQYMPEMMSNDIRTNYTETPHYMIPTYYCQNLFNYTDTDYRACINSKDADTGKQNTGWCGIEGDQFAFGNFFDVCFKLMPVPFAGTWEVRYYVSNLPERGLAQGYFGTNRDNLIATGLPFDLRLSGGDRRIGSIADLVLKSDSVLCIENDLQMRNHMYMKHTKLYCKNYFARAHTENDALRNRAESLRMIVYRGYMEPDKEYYFRFKSLLSDPDAYLFADGFEIVPKSIFDNPVRSEDIW